MNLKEFVPVIGHDTFDGRRERRSSRHYRDSGTSEHLPSDTGNKVTVKIYAEGEKNIDKALRQLKKAVEDDWIVHSIDDPVVLSLPQHKIDQIKRDAREHNIQIEIDHDVGGIKLQGLVKNMMPVKDKINAIIRTHEKSKHEYQQAKLLANIVRWFYLKDQKQLPFPDNCNKKVEEAYRNKESKVRVKDRSGGEYEIDFATMTEYDVKNTNEKFAVLRRDIMSESSLSQDLPKHWTKMKADENLLLVSLNPTDTEYKSVLADFTQTLGRNPTIHKIERIQNQALYIQYAAKRKQMNQQNSHRNDNERMLWHGTAAGPVTNINHHGFNRSYCRGCAYGDGVYFAVNSSYSDSGYSAPDANGHKRMYRCLVLTGDSCQGVAGMRMPPPKAGQQSHILYDSLSGPSMFIIFNDCQAYPEHLITYT